MDVNEINCSFTDGVYTKFLQKRYGINSCKKPVDLDLLRNQKQLSDIENYRDISSPLLSEQTFALNCIDPIPVSVIYCTPDTSIPVVPPITPPDTNPNPLRVYYGASDINEIDESDIEASELFIDIVDQAEFNLNYSYALGTPYYLWFAEDIAQPVKLHYLDTGNTDNQGSIGSDQDLFDAPVIVGKYRLYITVYKTEITNPFTFKIT